MSNESEAETILRYIAWPTTELWETIRPMVGHKNSEPDLPVGEIGFHVSCNDLFYWGTADCERFRVSDIPDMKQAIEDCAKALGESGYLAEVYGSSLWCCRKRKMRPQKPVLKHYSEKPETAGLVPLFLACGPERDPKSEG